MIPNDLKNRPGWRTSEFWITLALAFLGALLAAGVFPEDSTWARVAGAVLATGSALGYSVSRGLAKQS